MSEIRQFVSLVVRGYHYLMKIDTKGIEITTLLISSPFTIPCDILVIYESPPSREIREVLNKLFKFIDSEEK
jgi:hypothetical protein